MCKIRLPIIIIITICCQLIGCQGIIFKFNDHLREGDNCTLKNGVVGIYKKLQDCPSKLKHLQDAGLQDAGKRRISKCRESSDSIIQLRSYVALFDQLKSAHSVPIYNGLPAYINEFPFMAALGYTTDKNASSITYTCGGSLISVEHVLTAAHCVSNVHGMVPVEVRLGNDNLNNNKGVQRIPIRDIISHPQYRRSMNYNDVAILKLKFTVQISPTVMPICLQTKLAADMNITSDTDLVVIGWGRTSFESEKLSDKLMKTPSLRIVDNEVCNKSFAEFTRRLPHGITDNMTCAADPNSTRMADACPGDSGGPLLLSGYRVDRLIGIAAFGSFCGTTTPGVYTAIYPFLDWIEEHVWPVPPSDALPHAGTK